MKKLIIDKLRQKTTWVGLAGLAYTVVFAPATVDVAAVVQAISSLLLVRAND